MRMFRTDSGVIVEEIPHSLPVRRWLYRLSVPVRYSTQAETQYLNGESTTEFVVVSWGRDGDTAILPADGNGRALDFLGYADSPYWRDPKAFIMRWIDGIDEEITYVENPFETVRQDKEKKWT